MTEEEKEVYLKIYEMTCDRVEKSGGDMVGSKDTFASSLESESSFADLALLSDVSKENYFQALYYILYNRLVLPEEEKYYFSDNSGEHSKADILRKAYYSTERITAKRIVSNYIDYSADGNYKVGRLKRGLLKIYAGIKALIPLEVKAKIKNALIRKHNG